MKRKYVLTVVLAVTMLLETIPMPALAADTAGPAPEVTTEEAAAAVEEEAVPAVTEEEAAEEPDEENVTEQVPDSSAEETASEETSDAEDPGTTESETIVASTEEYAEEEGIERKYAKLSDAVNWMNNYLGKSIDFDRNYGAQCVDVFNKYLQDVFGISNPIGMYPVRYAYQIFDYNAPSGFTKISGSSSFQVGDIVIWNHGNGSTSGHVGIVYSTNNGTVQIFQQKYNGETTCQVHPVNSKGTIRGVFRPNFEPDLASGSEMTSGGQRWLPDGDYEIVSLLNSGYMMDISGDAVPAGSGTNVNLYQRTDRVQDVFTLTYLNNGFYSIKQKGTNKSLDVAGGSVLQYANIQMWDYHGGTPQQWAISPIATGGTTNGFRIQARCSGFSVDVENGNCANGVNIRQHPNNNSAAQGWVFIPYKPAQPIQNGRYILRSALADNLELDVAGDTGFIDNGCNVQIWTDDCSSRFNSFDVQKLSNGYYKLVHHASGKVLDSAGCVTTEGANIALWQDNGSDAQQWAITPNGNGYILRARCSGMAMDVQDGKKNNGTNVRQWTHNGSAAQTWYFVPAEHTVTYNANGGSGAPASQTKYYKNALALTTAAPTRKGYRFLGWSANRNATSVSYEPGTRYTADADLTLYAVWSKNKYQFSDVTDPSNSYYDAIYWAADRGITTGYSDGTFGIAKNCSRGAFVTFLWRQQGSPEPKLTAAKSGLKDFNSIGKSYQKAVLWAVEKGITTGYKDKTFRAGANVTRGAAVTFLWRAAGKPVVSLTREDVVFNDMYPLGWYDESGYHRRVCFTDMVPAGSSYETGILWAVENKITTGYSDLTFRPASNCTRGATVTFLKRFDELK